MTIRDLAKELNQYMKPDPPLPCGEENTDEEVQSELDAFASDIRDSDFGKNGLSRNAARALLKHVKTHLRPSTRVAAEKKAGRTGSGEDVAELPSKKSSKKPSKTSEEPAPKKPGKKSAPKEPAEDKVPKSKAAPKEKGVSLGRTIEEMLAASESEKKITSFATKVFADRGKDKEMGDEWVANRIATYILVAKRNLGKK
jgi:hypothetical protein